MNTARTPFALLVLILAAAASSGCSGLQQRDAQSSTATLPASIDPGEIDAEWLAANYNKREYRVPVRDGVHLFTAVYSPKDTSRTYPMLMKRTPYSVAPYSEDAFPDRLGPDNVYARDGYIFVYQDVRGKFMSEGDFVNMTPHVPDKQSTSDIDESTDAFDSITWLLQNVENHNGRVGMWGISYPGFYCSASMINRHPALVAVSPQAPIADWWFDDFHHHGAFFLPHTFNFMSVFGLERDGLTTEWPSRPFEYPTPDGYDFYLDHVGVVSRLDGPEYLDGRAAFWTQATNHPNYDEFWQKRNIIPHLKNVAPAVLVVGGWFDAEDLYGPLETYQSIERKNPGIDNKIIMGPWRHGGWVRDTGDRLGNAYFSFESSPWYMERVEKPFFDHHLKDAPAPNLAEATMFQTGRNIWREFETWPPADRTPRTLYAGPDGTLSFGRPEYNDQTPKYDEFVSDPDNPVPYTEEHAIGMTREYMTDDQRFASRRPDVLVYQTEPLEEDITLAGPVLSDLRVSTTGSAADWVVKLIDVHPGDHADYPEIREGTKTGGYQMMVRSEVIRGRFRNSHEHPEPFTPNEPTSVPLPLQDVLHTFKKGHRIMIQVQSTWFPLVDRNPQTYVPNIYKAEPEDFTTQTHRVYFSPQHQTRFSVGVLEE